MKRECAVAMFSIFVHSEDVDCLSVHDYKNKYRQIHKDIWKKEKKHALLTCNFQHDEILIDKKKYALWYI